MNLNLLPTEWYDLKEVTEKAVNTLRDFAREGNASPILFCGETAGKGAEFCHLASVLFFALDDAIYERESAYIINCVTL